MALISFTRIPATRKAQLTREGRTFSEEWRAITNNRYDDAKSILEQMALLGFPKIGDIYANESNIDFFARVTDISPEQDTHPKFWKVRVTWETGKPLEVTPFEYGGPLLEPIKETWDCEDTQFYSHEIRYLKIEAGGEEVYVSELIKNSAGERLVSPPPSEETILVYSRSENVMIFDPNIDLKQWKGQVNSKTWKSFGEGYARITKRRCEKLYSKNGTVYYKLDTEVKIYDRGWKLRYLDCGFNEKVGGVLRLIVGPTGRPYQTEPLLDGSGVQLAIDAEPVFITKQRFGTRDFNEIMG